MGLRRPDRVHKPTVCDERLGKPGAGVDRVDGFRDGSIRSWNFRSLGFRDSSFRDWGFQVEDADRFMAYTESLVG